MFFHRDKIEEYVMLRTDSHKLADIRHLSLDIFTINYSTSRAELKHSCEHRNERSLACSVVSKQTENLTVVHCNWYSIDCFFTITINSIHITQLKHFICLFLHSNSSSNLFNIILYHQILFVIIFSEIYLSFKSSFAHPRNKKQRVFFLSKIIRNDLVKVES